MNKTEGKRSDRIFFVICAIYIALCVGFILYYRFSENTEVFTAEELSDIKAANAAAVMAEKIVNINTASIEQLTTLDGIGESTAAKIIEYREANGGFISVDELTEVKGIGKAKLERIRPYVTIENAAA